MRHALIRFLEGYPGGRRAFCEAARITEGRLSQIIGGERPSPELAMIIHQLSDGRVPGSMLRPDLWRRPKDVPSRSHAA